MKTVKIPDGDRILDIGVDDERLEEIGTPKTDEWYQRHVEKLARGEIDAPLYDVVTYEGIIWFPIELGSDYAPWDGEPYALFSDPEKGIECVKRIGGVLAEDHDNMCKKLKLGLYAEQ